MVDPLTAAGTGALAKAVQSAADEGAKDAGGLLCRAFGPAADEIGQALARWTAYRVGNVQRIAAVADRKSIASGRDGMVNPRVARSLLEEGSYCDDELMGEYLGGLLAAGRSPTGRDDRAVSWTSLIASMDAVQVRLHFILYREWAYALGSLEDEEQEDAIASGQHLGEMYVDFDPVARALLGDDLEEGPSDEEAIAFATHAVAGLARLDLIAGVLWHVGASSKLREPRPDLPFDSMIHVAPTWPGIELFGWACGLPGYSFREFVALPEVPEFDVEIPRPAAVFPGWKRGEDGAGLAPPTGDDG